MKVRIGASCLIRAVFLLLSFIYGSAIKHHGVPQNLAGSVPRGTLTASFGHLCEVSQGLGFLFTGGLLFLEGFMEG